MNSHSKDTTSGLVKLEDWNSSRVLLHCQFIIHYSLLMASLRYIGQGFAKEERVVGFGLSNSMKTWGKPWPLSSHITQPVRVICSH
jgi:hypothetical protein